MDESYDFIVVGGGNAGAVVASRLAWSKARPSVLLLEAGGTNSGFESMSGSERYEVAFKEDSSANWGYKTVPQHGRTIDYSRGKGLGGSTAINFCGWLVGPRDDFDEIARLTGDNAFAWRNVKKHLKRIERLHRDVPSQFEAWIEPNPDDHGVDGFVDISYQEQWNTSVETLFQAGQQAGYTINKDVNDGDPIGLGIGPTCVYKSSRVTSASAYLSQTPPNLTVLTGAHVAKINLEGLTAIGVSLLDDTTYLSRQEIIVSGGAINSPQLLLLSGIGPASDLQKLGIDCQKDLPYVGANLQDHCFATAGIVVKAGHVDEELESKQTPSPMGWFKIDTIFESEEFARLSSDVKTFLAKDTIPMWEIATHTPFLDFHRTSPHENVLSAIALIMNPQSRGTVTLQSANPLDAPIIDPNFLSHPYDQRVAIESMRELLRFFQAPALRERTMRNAGWPERLTDEGLLAHFKSNLHSSWHMSGTVKMGQNPTDSCVSSEFKVHGVRRLRVVDMSVTPFVPNTHTQSTAYILGEIAATKMISEYDLDEEIPARL